MSEVSDAIDDMLAGRRSLDDVEAEFARRYWPAEPADDNSFTEVADAYTRGRIGTETYTRLALAAAEANRRHHHRQEDT